MALHGFGSDPILDGAGFRDRLARGEVRFVIVEGSGSIGRGPAAGVALGGGEPGPNDPVLTWVVENCRDVSSDVWSADGADSGGGGLGSLGRGTLYDCSGS